jgi:hypothetical protein
MSLLSIGSSSPEGTYKNVGQMLAASENAGPAMRTAMARLELNRLSQEYV